MNKPFKDLRLIFLKESELVELKSNKIVVRFNAKSRNTLVRIQNKEDSIVHLKNNVRQLLLENSGSQVRMIKVDQIIQSPIGGKQSSEQINKWIDNLPAIDAGDLFVVCTPIPVREE